MHWEPPIHRPGRATAPALLRSSGRAREARAAVRLRAEGCWAHCSLLALCPVPVWATGPWPGQGGSEICAGWSTAPTRATLRVWVHTILLCALRSLGQQARSHDEESFLPLLLKGRLELQSTPHPTHSRIQTVLPGHLQTRLTFGREVVAAEGRGVALHSVEA